MSTKHRVTMGDLPTIPQLVGVIAFPLIQMKRFPPEMQQVVVQGLVQQLVMAALHGQMHYVPKPVV